MTLNSSTTSVQLTNLTTGGSYMIRVVAYTRVGQGPYSTPVPLLMDPHQPPKAYVGETVNETWFLVLLAALLCTILSGFFAVFYLKKRQTPGKELGHLSGEYFFFVSCNSFIFKVSSPQHTCVRNLGRGC